MCFAPNGMHFFAISTSKHGPTLVFFVHFDFDMCFAPQRRKLCRHLNFQKWSEHVVLCAFWLGNVLRGVRFFDVSTSKSGPDMRCCVHFDLETCFAPQQRALFDIATSKSAPRLKCLYLFRLQLCIAPLTGFNFSFLIWPSGSAPAALASLLFDPPEPQIIGKNAVNRDFPTFSCTCLFLSSHSFFLFSDLLSSSLLLLDSSHLCFSICPYCRKFHF